jgi:FkbM family methyltransferase
MSLLRLRLWLKSRLALLRVPVQAGPLAGFRIGLFCGMRFIQGRYDRSTVATLQSLIRPGTVVYDIGAHVGYLTMVMARCVGPQGRVIAFEPLPLNCRYLRGHLRANRLHNVALRQACVAECNGPVCFQAQGGSGRGRLQAGSGGVFEAVSLDEEIGAGRLLPPDLIKMDVEGAEVLALRGAIHTLRAHRPTLIVSVHGPQLHQQCRALLDELGYHIAPSSKSNELIAQARA